MVLSVGFWIYFPAAFADGVTQAFQKRRSEKRMYEYLTSGIIALTTPFGLGNSCSFCSETGE
jgi:hypothetical protein